MRTLPAEMIRVLTPFAPLFSRRVFGHVQVLVAGAILAPGTRTVASALRAMGLEGARHFCRYHRVLSRAAWSSREASRLLLGLLVEAFVPEGDPLVLGVDETLERRRGKKVEVLYFNGCPTYETATKTLRVILAEEGVEAEIKLVAINSDEEAQRLRFPGSPTVRIDGRDLFPVPEREDWRLGCRVYATLEGLSGSPSAEMLREALKAKGAGDANRDL